MTYGVISILSLYNSNRRGTIIIKHIIGKLSLTTSHQVTPQVYLTISKLNLGFHRNISYRPAFLQNSWGDISQLDILFG